MTFSLQQNYPNPFNSNTRIDFSFIYRSSMSLSVYNVAGEYIISLIDEQKDPGDHSVIWNGKNSKGGDVVNGIYFIHLRVGQETFTRKMLFIR